MNTVSENPYAAPMAELERIGRAASGTTEGILTQLRGTRGWVRFISILFLLLALMTLLGAVGMVIGSATLGMGRFAYAIAGLYVIAAGFYVVLGLYLFRYASAIGRALASGSADDVEQALGLQRRFWRIASILGLVACVLGAISVAAMPMYQQYLQGTVAN